MFILIIMIFLPILAYAQPPDIKWESIIGGSEWEYCRRFIVWYFRDFYRRSDLLYGDCPFLCGYQDSI